MNERPAIHGRRATGWRWLLIAARSALFNLVFYLHLVAILVIATPVSIFLSERLCVAIASGWARRSLWLLRVLCKTRVEFRGLEHLPKGPFILATKHQSILETFAYLTVVANPSFVMKRELAFVPLWGWWAWKAGTVFVTRGARSVALRQIAEGSRRVLKRGRPLIIAPEGSRRLPGAPPAYKYGIAHLYLELGASVVPAALNSGLYWPRWSGLRFPGTIVISCLRPIPRGLTDSLFLKRLADDIEAECDRLLLESARSEEPPPFGPEAAHRLAAMDAMKADGAASGSWGGV